MENLVFEKPDDVLQSFNTGNKDHDLSVINALLAGNVQIGQKEEPVAEEVVQTEDTTTENTTDNQDVPPIETPTVSIDEMERQRRYIEFIEKQKEDERERYLQSLKDREAEIEKRDKAYEELQQRLQQLEQNNTKPVTRDIVDDDSSEDDEFVSPYTKQTRAMVEELKSLVEHSPLADAKTLERIKNIEREFEAEKTERQRREKENALKEQERKMFDNIRRVQIAIPELNTTKDIKQLDEDYRIFRKNIADVTKSNSVPALEAAIEDYFKGGETRKLADAVGIKPMDEYQKYNDICELIDFKDGMQYDAKSGKMIPIKDEDGNQIRYRSLEEAYRIKNYQRDIENARIKSYREVNNKLTQFNNAPATIPDNKTDEFSTNISVEKEFEILRMHPREYINKPELHDLVRAVYAKRGLPPPIYKGRQI